MAKILKLDVEYMKGIYKQFIEYMQNATFTDGKINFQRTLGLIEDKAELRFSEIAWLKMQRLIQENSKEVAWHGVAFRKEDEEGNVYFVSDILIYPQEVTGANVETDQKKYEMWLMSQEDDVFNNIRFQGHSHVNMGTTPSSVDTTHQSKILEQVEDDMFYIFVIWNKRNEKFVRIYDMKKNRIFETTDVTVTVQDDGLGVERFLREADEMVKEHVYTPPKTAGYVSPYTGSGYYGGYNGSYSGAPTGVSSEAQTATSLIPASGSAQVPPLFGTDKSAVKPVKETGSVAKVDTTKKKGRKGRRCDKDKGRTTILHMGGGNACDYFDQDGPYEDENDPRSAFGST